MEKCYKLHGYPNNFNKQPFKYKGGKYSNNAWSEVEGCPTVVSASNANTAVNTSPTSAITLPRLDADQSKQLLQFLTNLQLNKQASLQQSSSGTQNLSSAHMAGISLFSSQYVTSATSICCTCNLEGKT